MKNSHNDIYFVGVLQDLGIPYASLYCDKESRELYIIVRATDNDGSVLYAVAVSTNEIRSYMSEDIGLIKLFNNSPVCYATIDKNNRISLGAPVHSNILPDEKMKSMDKFDPDLCEDDIWLKTFIKRINNKQPIEVA